MQSKQLIEALRKQGVCNLHLNTARLVVGKKTEVPPEQAKTLLAWGSDQGSQCSEFVAAWRAIDRNPNTPNS